MDIFCFSHVFPLPMLLSAFIARLAYVRGVRAWIVHRMAYNDQMVFIWQVSHLQNHCKYPQDGHILSSNRSVFNPIVMNLDHSPQAVYNLFTHLAVPSVLFHRRNDTAHNAPFQVESIHIPAGIVCQCCEFESVRYRTGHVFGGRVAP